jgi:hypothetical protein
VNAYAPGTIETDMCMHHFRMTSDGLLIWFFFVTVDQVDEGVTRTFGGDKASARASVS